jgi:hypothetical protein
MLVIVPFQRDARYCNNSLTHFGGMYEHASQIAGEFIALVGNPPIPAREMEERLTKVQSRVRGLYFWRTVLSEPPDSLILLHEVGECLGHIVPIPRSKFGRHAFLHLVDKA